MVDIVDASAPWHGADGKQSGFGRQLLVRPEVGDITAAGTGVAVTHTPKGLPVL